MGALAKPERGFHPMSPRHATLLKLLPLFLSAVALAACGGATIDRLLSA